jgi:hypothetical protein
VDPVGSKHAVNGGTVRWAMKAKPAVVVLPPDPNRKHPHLAVVSHKGGGWYRVACMGPARKCREGVCHHTKRMSWADSERVFEQVPRETA